MVHCDCHVTLVAIEILVPSRRCSSSFLSHGPGSTAQLETKDWIVFRVVGKGVKA